MIEWMRKHMVWMMWGIIGLITVTFLFFGIFPSSQGEGGVAKVGGTVISGEELNRAYRTLYDNYRELLKDQFNDSLAKGLRGQALQELIVNRLLLDEAERMGLRISDEELQSTIMRMPSFQNQGKFDQKIYAGILDRINLTPAAFEASQRDYLLRQKLEQLVRDGVVVQESELKAAYGRKNPAAKPGEFEKDKDSFAPNVLAQKQRDALTAFIRRLQEKTSVKIYDRELAAS